MALLYNTKKPHRGRPVNQVIRNGMVHTRTRLGDRIVTLSCPVSFNEDVHRDIMRRMRNIHPTAGFSDIKMIPILVADYHNLPGLRPSDVIVNIRGVDGTVPVSHARTRTRTRTRALSAQSHSYADRDSSSYSGSDSGHRRVISTRTSSQCHDGKLVKHGICKGTGVISSPLVCSNCNGMGMICSHNKSKCGECGDRWFRKCIFCVKGYRKAVRRECKGCKGSGWVRV
jgi:hypothetical protein